MNTSLAPREATRTGRYAAATYRAFRITDLGTVPLDIGDVASLEEAGAAAQTHCSHKDHLAVRETGVRLREWRNCTEEVPFDRVHLYAIKRKAQPSYEYANYQTTRVHNLYADKVCVMDAEVFGKVRDEGGRE